MSERRWTPSRHGWSGTALRTRRRYRPVFRPRRNWRGPVGAIVFAVAFLAVGASLVATVTGLADEAERRTDPVIHTEAPAVNAGADHPHPNETTR